MIELPDALREKILREVIDTAPFPIGVYTGHKMKIVLANQCMIETYGKGPNVIGQNYTEILPELENQLIFEQLRDVLKTGIPYEAKNSRVDIVVEGVLKPHYFNYNFTPIFGEDKQVYGVMNTAAEVTALNVSRQQTIEIEKRLRLAVESSQLGTFEIDLENGIITGSKRFLKFFGTPIKNSLTLPAVQKYIHSGDKNLWEESVEKMYSKGQLQCEIRIKIENAVQWIRLSGTLSESDNKENIIVGIAQDISEERQHSEELLKLVEQRTAELKRSNDDLKQFGHVISHDLKEPLRKISMFSNLLLESADSSHLSKIMQYAQKINKSSARVSEMIDAILNYSSSGSLDLNEIVDLNEVLQSVNEDLELKIKDKNAIVEYASMPHLCGSNTLLYQLFLNLISNSLKFSRPGSDPIIKIEYQTTHESLHIFITDNGIGIAAENSQRIFNTFERLHSKDEYEGTGLGLSLCRKIVERHKGEIKLIPSENQGAVFEIIFPINIICR
ncbi:PAS domain-containing sensor histidine kinase [Flavobacterium limi]|uniref:histidine kinase n=1 Tax=Flavobacterium limi TaxID=2045105 RepID=A0ABQ1UZS2_9FLAO|nr:ATP-binding protein [Flavobacterium limi]GGF29493.1 hypothetical protein GCM10011518_43450 [Flavobacterium limi]